MLVEKYKEFWAKHAPQLFYRQIMLMLLITVQIYLSEKNVLLIFAALPEEVIKYNYGPVGFAQELDWPALRRIDDLISIYFH